MNELEKKLAEIRAAIKGLLALGEEISDDEAKKMADLNSQAVKLSARIEAQKQSEADEAEAKARIEREKAEAVAEARREEAAKARRLQFGDAPYQTRYADTSKYDDLSAGELGLVIETLNANGRQVSGAAFKALSLKVGELKDRENTEDAHKFTNYVKNAFKAATNIDATPEATSAAVKAATDPMYTGGSGIGSDWVGTAYSSELWQSIRGANVVVNRVPSVTIPDGYSSLYFPLESSDPTWYKVAEATSSDSTLKVPAATVAAAPACSTPVN
jgi:hypothetical protein